MPSNPFVVSGQMLQEVAHGLLDMKAKARGIESGADAYLPLTDDPTVTANLVAIQQGAQIIATESAKLYRLIAREAALS